MRATVMHATGDVRIENVLDPAIVDPTDAILPVADAWIRGSDGWPHGGVEPIQRPAARGYEYLDIVGQVNTRAKEMRVCVE